MKQGRRSRRAHTRFTTRGGSLQVFPRVLAGHHLDLVARRVEQLAQQKAAPLSGSIRLTPRSRNWRAVSGVSIPGPFVVLAQGPQLIADTFTPIAPFRLQLPRERFSTSLAAP